MSRSRLDDTTIETRPPTAPSEHGDKGPGTFGLVIVHDVAQPERLGEVGFVEGTIGLGRGEKRSEDEHERVRFYRQRPGVTEPMGPLETAQLSRKQLVLVAQPDGLEVESVGRCPMTINGTPAARGRVSEGDTIAFAGKIVFLVVRRPLVLPRLAASYDDFAFGAADRFGIVGESPSAWKLRGDLLFAAESEQHVLVLGESGTGKELAASAIHWLSRRAKAKLVARNAATIPDGLIDAELFGHARNYPNAGMPERDGLIGEADGSTLFLDEIGELPARHQAHLLRVMDAKGEYQRLGETTARRSDLRVVAATNREVAELKHDFAARLPLRVRVPQLDERAEDVPLLVRRLVAGMRREHSQLERFFVGDRLRIDAELVDALVRHDFELHARELATLLWQAASESDGDTIALTTSVRAALAKNQRPAEDGQTKDPTAEQVTAALARNSGNVTRAARELGLKNRFALYRLMKAANIPIPTRD